MKRLPSKKPPVKNQYDKSRARPTVLITGASGGIGRAISQAFGKIGWYVGVHYGRNKAAAEATLRQVMAVGGAGESLKTGAQLTVP